MFSQNCLPLLSSTSKSTFLCILIKKKHIDSLRLPNIRKKIELGAKDIDERLDKLPKPTEGEVQPKVGRKFQQFSMDIQNVLGTSSTYFMAWRDLRKQFRITVSSLKPKIILRDESDESWIPPQKLNLREGGTPTRGNAMEPVVLGDSDDESVVTHMATPLRVKAGDKRKRIQSQESPVKKVKKSPGHENAYREQLSETHFDSCRGMLFPFF